MTFLASNIVLSRFFKKVANFNVKCHLVYITKIDKYEITFVLKKYANKVPQGSPIRITFPKFSLHVPRY